MKINENQCIEIMRAHFAIVFDVNISLIYVWRRISACFNFPIFLEEEMHAIPMGGGRAKFT